MFRERSELMYIVVSRFVSSLVFRNHSCGCDEFLVFDFISEVEFKKETFELRPSISE